MTKRERKRARADARHARKVSRRALLKGAAIGVASLFIPRMAHAVLPKPLPHPTWDLLLDHVGAYREPTLGSGNLYQPTPDNGLRDWVHDLVLRPKVPQPTLLLTGPEARGKTLFHEAMKLLLPNNAVVVAWPQPRFFPMESAAWLMVLEECTQYHIEAAGNTTMRDDRGRYVKWSLTCRQKLDRAYPRIAHFDVRPPALAIPKPDLIRLLEDERDAFRETLTKYAA